MRADAAAPSAGSVCLNASIAAAPSHAGSSKTPSILRLELSAPTLRAGVGGSWPELVAAKAEHKIAVIEAVRERLSTLRRAAVGK